MQNPCDGGPSSLLSHASRGRSGWRLRGRSCLMLVVLALIGAGLLSDVLCAQDRPKTKTARKSKVPPRTTAPNAIVDPAETAAVLQRADSFGGQTFQPADPAAPVSAAPLAVAVEKAHVGMFYDREGQTRYVALQVKIANRTDQEVTFTRSEVSMQIDALRRQIETLLPPLVHHGFQYGTESFRLQELQPRDRYAVPARGVLHCWFIVGGIPMEAGTPKVTLRLALKAGTLDVDINHQQRGALGLKPSQHGPQNCLVVLKVGGYLNSFNLAELSKVLEEYAEKKQTRVILQWDDGAPLPDRPVLYFLQHSARSLGSGQSLNEQFVPLPVGLTELHFVVPASALSNLADLLQGAQGPSAFHVSLETAALAALRTAFDNLSTDDLLAQIDAGDRLSCTAAIVQGAGRLDASVLPRLIELSNQEDLPLAEGAIVALSNFGEPQAIHHLAQLAQGPDQARARRALASLAGSRYGQAHDAVVALFPQFDEARRQQALEVLAEHPRGEWRPLLAQSLEEDPSTWKLGALRAVVQLGDPNLLDILKRGLEGDDAVRGFAFQTLSQRQDSLAEQIALDYVRTELETHFPDGNTIQFLMRVKDPSVVPALIKYLDVGREHSSLIHLLASIGDQSVGDELARRYAINSSSDRMSLLNALRILRHPQFIPLASEALLSTEASLVSTAVEGLRQDGSEEACRALIDALQKPLQPYAAAAVIQALSQFTLPQAKQALLAQRESTDLQRRNQAITALQQMSQRSPGYQFIYQTQEFLRNKAWKDAEEMLGIIIEIDPELPDAYAMRATLHFRQGDYAGARSDVTTALNLDPYNVMALTGKALLQAMDGEVEAAIAAIRENRQRNNYDAMFHYNSACVYSRAIEFLERQPEADARRKNLEKYRDQCFRHLRLALSRGLDDHEWPKQDPDLEAVRKDPRFAKALGGAGDPEPEDDAAETEPAAEEGAAPAQAAPAAPAAEGATKTDETHTPVAPGTAEPATPEPAPAESATTVPEAGTTAPAAPDDE